MEIYWVQAGKKKGPSTVPDMISLVRLGEISADALGWHAGCKAWMPLRELPALADFLKEKPAEPAAEQGEDVLPPVPSAEIAEAPAAATETPAAAATSPDAHADGKLPAGIERVWLPSASTRLLARAVDVVLYMGLVYSAIYVQQLPYNATLLPSSPLFWLGFIAAEAALLSFFGTTPGKSFFGIRIVAFSEGQAEPLGLLRSLGRALMVFVGGMGMMCSFLPVLMGGFSWWMLKKHGITYWDARMSTFPAQNRPTGLPRRLLAVILIFFCLEVVGFCLQPWLPGVMEDLRTQSPEAAESLQRLMPELPKPEPTAGSLIEHR